MIRVIRNSLNEMYRMRVLSACKEKEEEEKRERMEKIFLVKLKRNE